MKQLTNKQLIESALSQIEEETGFHISHKYYGNSYFMLSDEDDSICNFKIKEMPRISLLILEH